MMETEFFHDANLKWLIYNNTDNEKEMNMRDILIKAFRSHAQGHVDKHRANVEVYLHNPAGVGEHPDIIEAIEMEMEEIAKYDDMLQMLEKYFNDPVNGNR